MIAQNKVHYENGTGFIYYPKIKEHPVILTISKKNL